MNASVTILSTATDMATTPHVTTRSGVIARRASVTAVRASRQVPTFVAAVRRRARYCTRRRRLPAPRA